MSFVPIEHVAILESRPSETEASMVLTVLEALQRGVRQWAPHRRTVHLRLPLSDLGKTEATELAELVATTQQLASTINAMLERLPRSGTKRSGWSRLFGVLSYRFTSCRIITHKWTIGRTRRACSGGPH